MGLRLKDRVRSEAGGRNERAPGVWQICTCVVAIIRMVGHSCNAGTHATEWWGQSGGQIPTMHRVCTIATRRRTGLARGQVGFRFCHPSYVPMQQSICAYQINSSPLLLFLLYLLFSSSTRPLHLLLLSTRIGHPAESTTIMPVSFFAIFQNINRTCINRPPPFFRSLFCPYFLSTNFIYTSSFC